MRTDNLFGLRGGLGELVPQIDKLLLNVMNIGAFGVVSIQVFEKYVR